MTLLFAALTTLVCFLMKRETLLHSIGTLPEHLPITEKLERTLGIGVGIGSAWYSSQKEHWVRWLSEYETTGVYGRRPNSGRSCKFIYNQLQCPPMVFWLGEALELPDASLKVAYAAAKGARKHHAIQTAAIRREIPWSLIADRIHQLSEGGATRCSGHTDVITPDAHVATGCSHLSGLQPKEFGRSRT